MKIELKCACGAMAIFTGDGFINAGRLPDQSGRVFLVEVAAAEWRAEHTHHAVIYTPRPEKR